MCSGSFKRNTFYQHTRLTKKLKFANPAFLAKEKSVVDQAWPGDVVGLYDTGNFKIGDTLTRSAIPGHQLLARNLQGIGQQRP